jgi:hypothetical protein
MKYKICILMTLVFLTNNLSSQEVKYFNIKGKQVNIKKASYSETIIEQSNGHKLLVRQRINKDTIGCYSYSSLDPLTRDGITKLFYKSGTLKYIKTYHDNILDGQITRFYEDGKIESIVLLYRDSILSKKSFDKTGKEIMYVFDGKPPRFKNKDMENFRIFLMQNVNYPQIPIDNKISRICKVSFSITNIGHVIDIDVKTDIIPFKNEIIKVIKSTDGHWIIGEMYGEHYKMNLNLNLNFNTSQ